MKKQFKAESKRLMELMINSIYTNKEIFLREIISNASDAIDKLYYKSLTDKKIKINKDDLEIFVSIDKENKTLTISDNGIGMTLEELENNLGTIAKSGSFDFKNKNEKKDNIDIIGQFGVGFYSAFMVASSVKVVSKAYGSDEAFEWVSTGIDGYIINKSNRVSNGTDIILTIKDNDDETYSNYLEEYEIRRLIKKYSDYITYPIKMELKTSKLKEGSKDEYEDVIEVQTINSLVPLWKRNKKDIKEEEYNEFIKNYEYTSFMQEIAWAKVKNNWENILCGIYENKKLIAACSILVKKLAKGFKMFYIPRGYLIDFQNLELLKFMTDNIKKLAKESKAYVVKIDPNFCVSEKLFKNQEQHFDIYSKDYKKKHDNLLKLGYIHTGFVKGLHENYQPRFQMAVPLIDSNNNFLNYEELLKTFKSKFRYYIGDFHKKRGVYFTYSHDKKDIKKFVQLLKCTEKNKNIHLRNEEYFNKILTNFKNRAYILFGNVDLEKYLEFLKNNNGKDEEIKTVENMIKEKGTTITLSSALLITPINKGIRCSDYLYAGNDLALSKLNISGGVALEAAKISIEHKCHYCNLGGISGYLDDSLTNFKSKYNAVILEYAGEYDLVINKFKYHFIKTFKPILTKIYKIIKK